MALTSPLNSLRATPTQVTISARVLETLQREAVKTSRAEARLRFLNLRNLPFSGSLEEGVWLLGMTDQEGEILVAKGHLKLLGNPADNGKKKLSLAYVLSCGGDEEWLNAAHQIITDFWKAKNQKKTRNNNPKHIGSSGPSQI